MSRENDDGMISFTAIGAGMLDIAVAQSYHQNTINNKAGIKASHLK